VAKLPTLPSPVLLANLFPSFVRPLSDRVLLILRLVDEAKEAEEEGEEDEAVDPIDEQLEWGEIARFELRGSFDVY